MKPQPSKPIYTDIRYLFLTRGQWKDRDAVVSEMQRLGASPEEINSRLGPAPPRIEATLRPASPPKLDTVEQWSDGWLRHGRATYEQYLNRQSAGSRQLYVSFMGEYPEEPKCRRKYGADRLTRWAAMRLLGRQWKEIIEGSDLKSADDLDNAVDIARKAVTDFLRWTRLDAASIARNRAAHACSVMRQLQTWREQGNEPAEGDSALEADAFSTLAEYSAAKHPRKRKNLGRPIGRPKLRLDHARLVKLRNAGKSWRTVATELGISPETARTAYETLSKK